eukprot:TRINITY_DN5141_c0_g1_i1.p1 TRINITY_DN5141_c0_g1~~TRINITY_DN5141_c0_g1_i1.p1  ORF type:complete len:1156 (+),score=66.33 TRINITY_DN5141_c0_g1_i1:71-3538(+)
MGRTLAVAISLNLATAAPDECGCDWTGWCPSSTWGCGLCKTDPNEKVCCAAGGCPTQEHSCFSPVLLGCAPVKSGVTGSEASDICTSCNTTLQSDCANNGASSTGIACTSICQPGWEGPKCDQRNPTAPPSASPTRRPSASPTQNPTGPSAAPTGLPTQSPASSDPSSAPATTAPSGAPSVSPPSLAPTPSAPTQQPTSSPVVSPSSGPSAAPTTSPTTAPTELPSVLPSPRPSLSPSGSPSPAPSAGPSDTPSGSPSASPVLQPSASPTSNPTSAPSWMPTGRPSASLPTSGPSPSAPSAAPVLPPSRHPSAVPSGAPSLPPTWWPSPVPSLAPSTPPSSQPTEGPTRKPSMPPTPTPTTLPTGTAPSRAPSPSPPSTAPATAAPSTPPLQQSTVRPSGSPSRQPTAAPSCAPPTAGPTAAPSLHLPPSAHPFAAPSSRPSSVVSAAPSLGPEADPSLPPSIGPFAMPSPAPSAVPFPPPLPTSNSSAPTAAPSVAPTGADNSGLSSAQFKEAHAALNALAGESTVAHIFIGAAAGPGAGKLAIVAGITCTVEDVDLHGAQPLDWEFSPTGAHIGDHDGMYFVGAVIMNPVIVLTFSVIHYFIVLVFSNIWNLPQAAAWGLCKFPGMAIVPLMFVLQGTSLSAANLTFKVSSEPPGVAVIGFISLLLCFALPVMLWFFLLRKKVFRAVAVSDPRLAPPDFPGAGGEELMGWKRKVYVHFLGPTIWVPLSGEDTDTFCHRYGPVFEQYRPGFQWVPLVDIMVMLALSMFSAWHANPGPECHIRNTLLLLDLGAAVVLYVAKQPLSAPFDNALATLMAVLLFLAVLIIAVSIWAHHQPAHVFDSLLDVAAVSLLVSAILMIVKAIYDFIVFIMDLAMSRKALARQRHAKRQSDASKLISSGELVELLGESAADESSATLGDADEAWLQGVAPWLSAQQRDDVIRVSRNKFGADWRDEVGKAALSGVGRGRTNVGRGSSVSATLTCLLQRDAIEVVRTSPRRGRRSQRRGSPRGLVIGDSFSPDALVLSALDVSQTMRTRSSRSPRRHSTAKLRNTLPPVRDRNVTFSAEDPGDCTSSPESPATTFSAEQQSVSFRSSGTMGGTADPRASLSSRQGSRKIVRTLSPLASRSVVQPPRTRSTRESPPAEGLVVTKGTC